MKKNLILLLLTAVLCLSGCIKEETAVPETPPVTEATTESPTTEAATESTTVETTAETAPGYDTGRLAEYLASVQEESDSIQYYLEHEALYQADMNSASQELYDLWDGALNYLWGELKAILPEEEFAVLLEEQRTWITEKEAAAAEAGEEVAGGSLYPLVVNSKAAKLTEERVWQLFALLS